MEIGPTEEQYKQPLHPYTQALLKAVPRLDGSSAKGLSALKGEIPSSINLPSGCPFHTRCPLAVERCRTDTPELRELQPGREVACHLA